MRCHYRRDGKSKVSFDNLGKVKSVCICFWEKNEDMRPYKCRLCNKYHKAAKRSKRQQSLEPKKEEMITLGATWFPPGTPLKIDEE